MQQQTNMVLCRVELAPIGYSGPRVPKTHLTIVFMLFFLLNQCSFGFIDRGLLFRVTPSSSSIPVTRFVSAVLDKESKQQGLDSKVFVKINEESALPLTSRSGFTFDPCMSDRDCKRPRKCTVFNRFFKEVPCKVWNASVGCTCDWERPCRKRSDCPKGEVCAGLKLFGLIISRSCTSEVVAVDKPELVPLRNGLTMDECRRDSDCHRDRRCLKRMRNKLRPCGSKDRYCVCFRRPARKCISSSRCDLGERCAKIRNFSSQICISDAAVDKRKSVLAVGGALGLEPCARRTDCAGDRSCIVTVKGRTDFCAGRRRCFCGYPFRSCSIGGKPRGKCYKGEICVGIKGRRLTRCAAKNIVLSNPNLKPVNKILDVSSKR